MFDLSILLISDEFEFYLFSGSDLVFPDCIQVNRSVVLPFNDLAAYKLVFKVYSADVCAKKAKKEEDQLGFSEQKVMWNWYSATTECEIYVFVNDPKMELAPLQIGRSAIYKYQATFCFLLTQLFTSSAIGH